MRIVIGLLALVVAVASCGGPNLDSAMESAKAKGAIDSLWTAFAVAADRRDAIEFESLFTDEATLVWSGSPTVTGKSAIGAFLVDRYTPIDETGFKVTPEDLMARVDLAAQSGTFEERFTRKDAPMLETGRFVLVAEKGSGGAWRIRRLVMMPDSTVKAAD